MAKITWLGEDGGGVAGPSFTTCFDRKFPKGEAVEVKDADIIKRASNNPFFKVTGADAVKPEPKAEGVDSLDDLKIAELRELAETRGINHDGLSKSDLRDTLKAGDEPDAS